MEMTSQSRLSESGWPTGRPKVDSSRAAARQRSDVTMRRRNNARRLYIAARWQTAGARGVSAGSQLQESSWKEPRSTVSLLASERQTHC